MYAFCLWRHLLIIVLVYGRFTLVLPSKFQTYTDNDWQTWLNNFGRDSFQYPEWITQQMQDCLCKSYPEGVMRCFEKKDKKWQSVDPLTSTDLTYCVAKQWLLDHMPEFDKHFLPPSVSVNGKSMFDDNIAFTLMANNASLWSSKIPQIVKLAYLLPYATFHEARVNWRPLFFAKYFELVSEKKSTVEAMKVLVSPPYPKNEYINWTSNIWSSYPARKDATSYYLQWASETSPPSISVFDFSAYGYGSCTAWSTLLTYISRSVGIPSRQVGTPCWNSGEFSGLASQNPNVSFCWHGGDSKTSGGIFLNNHNWVEFWDNLSEKWVFVNVPPGDFAPNTGLCENFTEKTGCGYNTQTGCKEVNSGPGAASRDHEIFSVTWNLPSENFKNGEVIDGGPIIDVKTLRLSSGEEVSPLVWSPYLTSPIGEPLKDVGLRVVNRTDFYRCKIPTK